MSAASSQSVSFIGLGLMGSAMVQAFLRKGIKTTVWNRSIEKASLLVAQGAILAESAAECVEASLLVVVCLTDSDAFEAALGRVVCSRPHEERILVNFTTGSPSQIRKSAELAKNAGFSAYVHGAVLAYPRDVGSPTTILFYSGAARAYQSAVITLTALGTPVYLDEDVISSALQEVLLVSAAYTSWMGFIQSMALLRTTKGYKSGSVTAQSFVNDVLEPVFLDSIKTYKVMAREIDERDYKTKGTGAVCSLHLTSLRNMARTYREEGLSTELLDTTIGMVERRVEQGGSDDELSSLIELISGQLNQA